MDLASMAIATSSTVGGVTTYYPAGEWHILIILLLVIAGFQFIDLIRRMFAPFSK